MQGNFILQINGEKIILPNTVVNEGEEAYLKMLLRDDQTIVAGGADFFIGLVNRVPDETDTLAIMAADEIPVANGYARQPVPRNSTGWPTLDSVNGRSRILSDAITFTAAGGDFTSDFTRAFMCNVVSGTAGVLFSYSGALTAPLTVLDTESFQMQYEVFLD